MMTSFVHHVTASNLICTCSAFGMFIVHKFLTITNIESTDTFSTILFKYLQLTH